MNLVADTVRQEWTRRTVSLTPRQERKLKEEAERLGISVSDLLRRMLDRWLDQMPRKDAPAVNRSASTPTASGA